MGRPTVLHPKHHTAPKCLERMYGTVVALVALVQGGRLPLVLLLSIWIAARALARIMDFDFEPVT